MKLAEAADFRVHSHTTIGEQRFSHLRALGRKVLGLSGKKRTRDAVFQLVNAPTEKDPDKWKLADLQKVIAYEDSPAQAERRGELVGNVLDKLEWLCRTLEHCAYNCGPIDELTRVLGSEFHNFYQDGTEYICSGQDVFDREERVVYGEGEPQSLPVFATEAFLAYLDFPLKVFLHEFFALPRLAQQVLIAQNVALYKTGQSQKQVLENLRVPAPEHVYPSMQALHVAHKLEFANHPKTADVRTVACVMYESGLYASEVLQSRMHDYAKINADVELQNRLLDRSKKELQELTLLVEEREYQLESSTKALHDAHIAVFSAAAAA